MSPQKELRMKSALERLETQLTSGVKSTKSIVRKETGVESVKLDDQDIKKIKDQIKTLKAKL